MHETRAEAVAELDALAAEMYRTEARWVEAHATGSEIAHDRLAVWHRARVDYRLAREIARLTYGISHDPEAVAR
jgi:hypothetical protein